MVRLEVYLDCLTRKGVNESRVVNWSALLGVGIYSSINVLKNMGDKLFNIENSMLAILAIATAGALALLTIDSGDLRVRMDSCQETVAQMQSDLAEHVREAVRYKDIVISNRGRLDGLSQSRLAREVAIE